jgi:hypothetical protein
MLNVDTARQVNMEKRERRIGVMCVLQAEEDRRYLRWMLKSWDLEAEAMKVV